MNVIKTDDFSKVSISELKFNDRFLTIKSEEQKIILNINTVTNVIDNLLYQISSIITEYHNTDLVNDYCKFSDLQEYTDGPKSHGFLFYNNKKYKAEYFDSEVYNLEDLKCANCNYEIYNFLDYLQDNYNKEIYYCNHTYNESIGVKIIEHFFKIDLTDKHKLIYQLKEIIDTNKNIWLCVETTYFLNDKFAVYIKNFDIKNFILDLYKGNNRITKNQYFRSFYDLIKSYDFTTETILKNDDQITLLYKIYNNILDLNEINKYITPLYADDKIEIYPTFNRSRYGSFKEYTIIKSELSEEEKKIYEKIANAMLKHFHSKLEYDPHTGKKLDSTYEQKYIDAESLILYKYGKFKYYEKHNSVYIQATDEEEKIIKMKEKSIRLLSQ